MHTLQVSTGRDLRHGVDFVIVLELGDGLGHRSDAARHVDDDAERREVTRVAGERRRWRREAGALGAIGGRRGTVPSRLGSLDL